MKKIVFLLLVITAFFTFPSAMAADEIYSATTSGELSLHISPDEESYIVATIPACSKMELMEEDKTWGLVKVNNKCGWVNLSFTRNSYNDAAESTGTDAKGSIKINGKGGKASLYNVPSTDRASGGAEKYRIPNGTVLKITRETASGWGLVSMNGEYSWIKMEDSLPFAEELDTDKYGIFYVYVLSDDGRGISLWSDRWRSRRYAVIPDCVRLTVQETDGDYALVAYNGINGWIDLRQTAESLLNAQTGAGVEVSEEYVLMPEDAESIKVFSVPSHNLWDGGIEVATIKKESTVFVLRSTMNGWGLIYYKGQLGWVPPGSFSPVTVEKPPVTEIMENPIKGYVFTEKGKGMALFAKEDGKTKVATIPECVEINIIAQKDGYEFVSCDYGCGWVKEGEYAENLNEAQSGIQDAKKVHYIIKNATNFMSLPTTEENFHSVILKSAEKGTVFECIRTVTTGKDKWALAEIDGQKGWINLGDTRKVMSLYLGALAALVIIAVICCAIYMLYRLKRKKTKGEQEDETKQGLCYTDSGAQEKALDVSGE